MGTSFLNDGGALPLAGARQKGKLLGSKQNPYFLSVPNRSG